MKMTPTCHLVADMLTHVTHGMWHITCSHMRHMACDALNAHTWDPWHVTHYMLTHDICHVFHTVPPLPHISSILQPAHHPNQIPLRRPHTIRIYIQLLPTKCDENARTLSCSTSPHPVHQCRGPELINAALSLSALVLSLCSCPLSPVINLHCEPTVKRSLRQPTCCRLLPRLGNFIRLIIIQLKCSNLCSFGPNYRLL